MENCIGIINNSNLESEFGQLCKNRPVYMLPFGGRYRLVDVIISNMVNNGIKTVAIYTGEKIRSTMDHLGDGKPYNLNSRFQGLFLYPPISQEMTIARLGDIADFYSTISFLEQTREDNVMIVASNMVFKANMEDAYKHFCDTAADVTLFYTKKHDERGDYINAEKIHLNDDGMVSNVGINLGTEVDFNMYMNSMFIKKSALLKIVKETVEKGNAANLKEAILRNKNRFKINSYQIEGIVENVRDIYSYYKANLNLLNRDTFDLMFNKNGRVMTKTKDEPSTVYRDYPQVENSMIANGCEIEGDIENSIIFRGVKIGKNATVKNSIIMQKCEIGDNAVVVNSILDKYSVVGQGASLVGSYNQPYVLGKYEKIERE